jgi:hypothetical protein
MARRKIKLVDLCKINTDAFRHMTRSQLAHVKQQVGSYLDFTKAELFRADGYGVPRKIERKARHNNALLMKFVTGLDSRLDTYDMPRQSQEAYRRTFKEEPMPQAKITDGSKREAARIEKAIWDLQVRAGCSIKGSEQVARDAVRADKPEAAARIRKKAIIR